MTEGEIRLYRDAMTLADRALGSREIRGYRGSPRHSIRVANEDPAAWWCLTECMVSLAKRYAGEV